VRRARGIEDAEDAASAPRGTRAESWAPIDDGVGWRPERRRRRPARSRPTPGQRRSDGWPIGGGPALSHTFVSDL